MKIDYDVTLFKKIANFSTNEVIQVSNRKSRRSTIHITNITRLTWQELQLLVPNGSDKFTKRVLLYRELSNKKAISESVINGKSLSSDESREINEYVNIFRDYGCTEHHEANEIISQGGDWDSFKTIRSLNDHGKYKYIEGIQPKYFEIICHILKISGGNGLPLDGYTKY